MSAPPKIPNSIGTSISNRDNNYSWLRSILVINLDSRPDRWEIMKKVWSETGVPHDKIQRIPAKKLDPGFRGCTYSHWSACRYAWQEMKDDEWVMILEDDCVPMDDPKATIRSLQTAIQQPHDMIMVSMTPIRLTPLKMNGVHRIQQALGMPGYLVQRSFLPKLIRIFEEAWQKKTPHDLVTQLYQPAQQWIGFFPPIARQLPGHSDIEQGYRDYTALDVKGVMLSS